MAKFNVLSKQCPVCSGRSVVRIRSKLGLQYPTHRCPDCGSDLKASFTAHALLSIPVTAVAVTAMYFIVQWLQHSSAVTGMVRGGLVGLVIGVAFAIPAQVGLRGIVLRRCAPPSP